MKRITLILCVSLGMTLMGCHSAQQQDAPLSDGLLIVPGVRIGHCFFDMNTDDVIAKLGEPDMIFFGQRWYTLNTLPEQYYLGYEGISLRVSHNRVQEMTARSPSYQMTNGLSVGSSEKEVKKAMGKDFDLQETESRDFLNYPQEGIQFEIHKTTRTVHEINITRP